MQLAPKLKATGIHLGISLTIFVMLALFVYLAWYPQPYFSVSGGWQGLRLLLLIQLVIGPLLTLIIFNPGKSRRAFAVDYTFITIAQGLALGWGLYATYTQRPVAVVYHDGIFEAHTSDIFAGQEINGRPLKLSDLARFSDEQPPLIYARKAETEDEQAGVATWEFIEGVPEHGLVFLFEPLTSNMQTLIEHHQQHFEHLNADTVTARRLHGLMQSRHMKKDEIVIAPFEGRYGNAWMVLTRHAQLLGII